MNSLELGQVSGLGPVNLKKLQEAGIISVVDLAACSVQELSDRINSTKPTANQMILAAQKLLREHKYLDARIVKASELLEERQSSPRLTTGSKELDNLLKGGIETGAITEFYGEFGSGKTQVCFTLSVMATQPADKGGFDGTVLYIDTENTFKNQRIKEICEHREIDPTFVLDRILVSRVFGVSDFDLTMKDLENIIIKHGIKLIVIDGIMSQFRAEFTGRGTLAERQQSINPILNKLKKLSEVHKIAVIVTNQVMSNPDGMFTGEVVRATGGHILSHGTTYRIYLRKIKKVNRVARIVDSPYHALSECIFTVSEAGVTDIEK